MFRMFLYLSINDWVSLKSSFVYCNAILMQCMIIDATAYFEFRKTLRKLERIILPIVKSRPLELRMCIFHCTWIRFMTFEVMFVIFIKQFKSGEFLSSQLQWTLTKSQNEFWNNISVTLFIHSWNDIIANNVLKVQLFVQ